MSFGKVDNFMDETTKALIKEKKAIKYAIATKDPRGIGNIKKRNDELMKKWGEVIPPDLDESLKVVLANALEDHVRYLKDNIIGLSEEDISGMSKYGFRTIERVVALTLKRFHVSPKTLAELESEW